MAVLLESSRKLSPMSATEYSERPTSRDEITGRIAKRSIRLLLQEEGFHHQDILDLIDPRGPTVEERGEELELVEKAADRVRQLIKDPNQPKPPSLADLTSQRWIIHAGNVHSEYTHVAQQLFSDGVNWGRVIAFLGFSVTYCLYAIQQGVQESIVESVTAWAVLFLEQELRDWFRQHSWDQFVKYADKILQSNSSSERNGLAEAGSPTWQRLATVGIIGLGAALAFSLRNAFSS